MVLSRPGGDEASKCEGLRKLSECKTSTPKVQFSLLRLQVPDFGALPWSDIYLTTRAKKGECYSGGSRCETKGVTQRRRSYSPAGAVGAKRDVKTKDDNYIIRNNSNWFDLELPSQESLEA